MGEKERLTRIRVVMDTNVVLSALLFAGGTASRLRMAWQSRRFQPLVSRDTAQELLRVLSYPKFKLTPDEQKTLLADYLPYCETVSIHKRVRGVPRCRDPLDRKFLVLAVAGGADALVTGDADLLAVKQRFAIPIMTLRDFLARVAS